MPDGPLVKWRSYNLDRLELRPGHRGPPRARIAWTLSDKMFFRAFLARHAHSPCSLSPTDRASCTGCTEAALRALATDALKLDLNRVTDAQWAGVRDRMLTHFAYEMNRWVEQGDVRLVVGPASSHDAFAWDERFRQKWLRVGDAAAAASLDAPPSPMSASPPVSPALAPEVEASDPLACRNDDGILVPLPHQHRRLSPSRHQYVGSGQESDAPGLEEILSRHLALDRSSRASSSDAHVAEIRKRSAARTMTLSLHGAMEHRRCVYLSPLSLRKHQTTVGQAGEDSALLGSPALESDTLLQQGAVADMVRIKYSLIALAAEDRCLRFSTACTEARTLLQRGEQQHDPDSFVRPQMAAIRDKRARLLEEMQQNAMQGRVRVWGDRGLVFNVILSRRSNVSLQSGA